MLASLLSLPTVVVRILHAFLVVRLLIFDQILSTAVHSEFNDNSALLFRHSYPRVLIPSIALLLPYISTALNVDFVFGFGVLIVTHYTMVSYSVI